MSNIISLPYDVFKIILLNLQVEDIANIRRASKSFYEYIDKFLKRISDYNSYFNNINIEKYMRFYIASHKDLYDSLIAKGIYIKLHPKTLAHRQEIFLCALKVDAKKMLEWQIKDIIDQSNHRFFHGCTGFNIIIRMQNTELFRAAVMKANNLNYAAEDRFGFTPMNLIVSSHLIMSCMIRILRNKNNYSLANCKIFYDEIKRINNIIESGNYDLLLNANKKSPITYIAYAILIQKYIKESRIEDFNLLYNKHAYIEMRSGFTSRIGEQKYLSIMHRLNGLYDYNPSQEKTDIFDGLNINANLRYNNGHDKFFIPALDLLMTGDIVKQESFCKKILNIDTQKFSDIISKKSDDFMYYVYDMKMVPRSFGANHINIIAIFVSNLNIKILQYMLDLGANFLVLDGCGNNLLYYAISRIAGFDDHVVQRNEVINFLVDVVKLDINHRNFIGRSIAHSTQIFYDLELMRFLIKKGLDISSVDIYGNNIIHNNFKYSELSQDGLWKKTLEYISNNPKTLGLIVQKNILGFKPIDLINKKAYQGTMRYKFIKNIVKSSERKVSKKGDTCPFM